METGVKRLAFNSGAWTPSEREWEFALASFADAEERKRITRFRFDKDRKHALGSRCLQRRVVGEVFGVPWEEVRIERTKENKPYLPYEATPADLRTRYPNWNFNVTHHADYVALASEPVCIVGVDVMDLDDRPRTGESFARYADLMADNFTATEWAQINKGRGDGERYEQFYRFWAMKEGFIKATGIGLGYPLQRVEFELSGRRQGLEAALMRIDGRERPEWDIRLGTLDDRHSFCVARGPAAQAGETFREVMPATIRGEVDAVSAGTVYEEGRRLAHPAFTTLSIPDLLPPRRRSEFIEEFPQYQNEVLADKMAGISV